MAAKKRKKTKAKAKRRVARRRNVQRVSSLVRRRQVQASATRRRTKRRRGKANPKRAYTYGAYRDIVASDLKSMKKGGFRRARYRELKRQGLAKGFSRQRNARRRQARKITISDPRVAAGVVKALRSMGYKAKLGKR